MDPATFPGMKWNGTESWPPARSSSQIRRSRYSVLQKAKPGWSTKDLLKVLGQKSKGEPRRHIYIYMYMEKSFFLNDYCNPVTKNKWSSQWTSIYRWFSWYCWLSLIEIVMPSLCPTEVQGITLVIPGHCHSPGFVWWPPKNLVGSCIPVYFLRWLWVKTMVTSGDIPCRLSGWLPWKIPKSLSEISWLVKEIPSGYST